MAATGGVPLAVHRAAAEWAHSEAATLVATSAQRAASERSDLRAAEADLAGKVVGLQAARERLVVDDAPPEAAVCPYLGLTTFDVATPRVLLRSRATGRRDRRPARRAPLLASSGRRAAASRRRCAPAGAGPGRGVLPGATMGARAHAAGRASARKARSPDCLTASAASLAVDQFEEVFTACRDEGERAAFIEALVRRPTRRRHALVVLALPRRLLRALRGIPGAGAPARREPRARRPDAAPTNYARAIERPAARGRVARRAGAGHALVDDVRGRARRPAAAVGGAARAVAATRRATVLRCAAYEQAGGVRGAVARLAEQTYGASTRTSGGTRARHPGAAGGRRRGRRQSCAGACRSRSSTRRQRAARARHRGPDRRRLVTVGGEHGRGRARGAAARVAAAARLARGRRRGPPAAPAPDRMPPRLGERGRDPGELYRGARLASALDWAAEATAGAQRAASGRSLESRAAW